MTSVLHVVYSFPPDPPGGTEVYVEGLARDLAQLGVAGTIAAPADEDRIDDRDGLVVHRYASTPSPGIDVLYGRGDPLAGRHFAKILDRVRPDVVHMHALSPGCSMTVVDEVVGRGLPLVFTYHTPAVSCPRGTLLLEGKTPCDGELRADRCTSCVATSRGVAPPVARLLARLPAVVGEGLRHVGLGGRTLTGLRLRGLLEQRRAVVRAFLQAPDRIVALAPWVHGVLEANGVSAERVVDSAHGLTAEPDAGGRTASGKAPDVGVRIAHLGRLHPVKGTAVLIEALRRLPGVPVHLDIYGIVQGETGASADASLRARAQGDPRIEFLAPLPNARVVPTLRSYDAVAVPSQWMETGPLVVLEAFAAGVPVIGSALGGIADKVRDGANGLLISPPGSVEAWADVLRRCAEERTLLSRLAAGVAPPRLRLDVARDMRDLYQDLLRSAPAPAGTVTRGA